MDFLKLLENELEELRAGDRMRKLRSITPDGKYAWFDGQRLLNLSGNDYLGLAAENTDCSDFMAEFTESFCAMTASSSRLLTGTTPAHAKLEALLEELYGRPALSFNSGYHANTGILPALAKRGDLILCDKLNHASIIDGIRLSDADFKRYPHLDMEQLKKMLEKYRSAYNNIFIITESVFSMDGDIVNLEELIDLKKQYNAFLIVDEAHGVGTFGDKGLGVCEWYDLIDDIDIIIGTFGKALASVGAYAITNAIIKDYLINRMRTLIFTTALPPACAAWSVRMLKRSVEMNKERKHLHDLSTQLRDKLYEKKVDTRGCSHIVPAILGKDEAAATKAAELRDAGLLVFPIRPPTVPPGTARLRFSLNAAMQWDDIKTISGLL